MSRWGWKEMSLVCGAVTVYELECRGAGHYGKHWNSSARVQLPNQHLLRLRSSQSKLNPKAVWTLTFKSVKWHIGNVTVLVCFFIWGREWALTTRLTWKELALHGMTSDFTLLVCHTALMCQQAGYRDDAVCAVDPWKFPFRVEERGVALRKPWRLTEMFSWPFTESAGVPLESITLRF